MKNVVTLLFVLIWMSVYATQPLPEVAGFLRSLNPKANKELLEAIRCAQSGDVSPLNVIRNARADTPPPVGIGRIDTVLNGVNVQVYYPLKQEAQTYTTVIYLHGGGWVIGNLKTCSRYCGQLAAMAQVVVIAVDYRLAPEYPYPAAQNDVLAVIKAVQKGVCLCSGVCCDPQSVFVGGDSAGGHLAITTALQLFDGGCPLPAGLILYYPVTDLLDDDSESWRLYGKGYALDSDVMAAFIDAYVPSTNVQVRGARYLSPLRSDIIVFPPTLLITSELDILHDQGKAFADKLRQGGHQVFYYDYVGACHIYITVQGMDVLFLRALNETVAFLKMFSE